ncbi:MAG: amidohydrolase family protein, partial [Verrucomicrobia bacterium]|nr:amidohydrolase family protein [Verrucomicrobiota bacterium]
MTTVLKGGKIIDGTGAGAVMGDVVIDGDRIVSVGNTAPLDPDARVVDVTGKTVLPGLVDPHVHITYGETLHEPRSWTAFSKVQTEQESGFFDLTAKAGRDVAAGAYACRRTLCAGFTTVRDVGVSAGGSDIVLREAIRNGFLPGPRILACGGGIAMTGGHGWNIGVIEADGVDALRTVTRRQLKAGADVIKIFATRAGGGEWSGGPEFSIDEMRVICDEARQRGKHVAAHAVGAEGIKRAVLAGVNTIEHGCLIDEEAAEMMVEHGTWLISTLYPFERQATRAKQLGYPDHMGASSAKIMEVYPDNLRMAARKGVKIALGSDCGIPDLTPHGENALEIILYERLVGVSSVEAIHLATGAAAEAIRLGDDIGTLASG